MKTFFKLNMKLLALLFISSCGMNQLQSSYERKYTATVREYCPDHYIMAHDINGRRFCVLDNNSVYNNKTEVIYNNTPSKQANLSDSNLGTYLLSKKGLKPLKKPIRPLKIDNKSKCETVFKQVNACMGVK